MLFITLFELVSFLGYFNPTAGKIAFALACIAAIVLTLQKLEYGLLLALSELVLGSKGGYLLSFPIENFTLSLRIALFIIVMSVFFLRAFQTRRSWQFADLRTHLLPWIPLAVFVLWGMIIGIMRDNDFGNVLLDANGYWYAALLLPAVFALHNDRKFSARALHVLASAVVFLAAKTLILVYLFSHGSAFYINTLIWYGYRWIRATEVGEITVMPTNFVRIFMQSHIFILAGFLAALIVFLRHTDKTARKLALGCAAVFAGILLTSFSRSYWVGLAAGLLVFTWLLFMRDGRITFSLGAIREKLTLVAVVMGAFLTGGAILAALIFFPYPRPSAVDLLASLKDRSLEFGDAATSSRWNLLPPLLSVVKEHTILGSGFGTTVTYTSDDPRVRETNPSGRYTTYAFEWGYLDIWLKMGLGGLFAFVWLFFSQARAHLRSLRFHPIIAVSSLAALVALFATSIFSPYLNHPLGLGLLIITGLAIKE